MAIAEKKSALRDGSTGIEILEIGLNISWQKQPIKGRKPILGFL